MSYFPTRRALSGSARPRRRGLGGFDFDSLVNFFSPQPTVPPNPDVPLNPDGNLNPTHETVTATEGGVLSPIPSSQPGGGSSVPSTPFVSVGGVCKPTNSATLSIFKDLQRQLNRVAEIRGLTKIGVDGAIGGQTMGLLRQVQAVPMVGAGGVGFANAIRGQNSSSCAAVSGNAWTLAANISQLADALNAPASVDSPAPESSPSTVDPRTGQETPQGPIDSARDVFGNMSSTTQVVVAIGVLGAGYMIFTSKKRKRS